MHSIPFHTVEHILQIKDLFIFRESTHFSCKGIGNFFIPSNIISAGAILNNDSINRLIKSEVVTFNCRILLGSTWIHKLNSYFSAS